MISMINAFKWILSASLMASILVILILIIKFLIKGKLSPRWQYLLWLLFFFRLLFPWMPQSSFSIFNVIPVNQQEGPLAGQEIVLNDIGIIKGTLQEFGKITNHDLTGQSASANQQIGQYKVKGGIPGSTFNFSGNILNILFDFWLSGALAIGFYVLFKNSRFMSRVRKGSFDVDLEITDIFNQCKDKMSIKRNIGIVRTGAVTSPTLCGLVRPKVLLPLTGMDGLNQNEWSYVFVHELAHFKRNDIMVNCLITVLVIIHWFNPIIAYGFKRMRDDQEIACDSLALSILGTGESQDYGYTMIKLLENGIGSVWKPGIASFSTNKSQLKRRITMIKLFKNGAYRLSIIGLVLMIALAGCTLTNGKTGTGKVVEDKSKGQQSDTKKPADNGLQTNTQIDSSKDNSIGTISEDKTTNPGFKSIYMVNKLDGWGMSNKAVYHTTDGGKTWTDITPKDAVLSQNNNEQIARFAYIDGDTGFLAVPEMNAGTIKIYKTIDSGKHWSMAKASNTAEKSPYVGTIDFIDKDHGWLLVSYGVAMGSQPVEVYRTVDGGSTWDKVAGINTEKGESGFGLLFGGHKTGLAFFDANNGYITGFDYGNNLYLYATRDGGVSWQRQSLQTAKGHSAEAGSAETMAPIIFSAKEGLLPVIYHEQGQTTFFYSTEDGGKTWQVTSAPIKSVANNQFTWSFPDRMHGFATDGNDLYVTKDGAKSWSKITYSGKDFQNIYMIDFVNENDGFALGDGFLLKTSDGGKTWVKSANTNN